MKPTTVEFGDIPPGGSASRPITITNDGSTLLRVSSVQIVGNARGTFRVGSIPVELLALQPGANIRVMVSYLAAPNEGVDTASLIITIDEPSTPTRTVSLSGRTLAPSCLDGVRNGTETDLDCGGSCPGCGNGSRCAVNIDCASQLCSDSVCTGRPTLSIATATSAKEGGPITFAVTQSTAIGADVRFSYATKDGTAKAGTDFVGQSNVGSIAAGATSTDIVVTSIATPGYQGDLKFSVVISNAVNAMLGNATSTATLLETSPVPPTVSYTTPVTYSVYQAIAPNQPSMGGGAATLFSISPPLPAGLGLDGSSGVLSGTPAVAAEVADYTVTATNSGGSGTAKVNIAVSNPAPTTLGLSPGAVSAGHSGFPLTVSGTLFVSGATVNWNDAARTTTFVNSTKVVATMLAADVSSAGSFRVTVANPTPGGGTSSVQTFTVYPRPTISSGFYHSCAVVNGGAWCWGLNTKGQLGNGSFTNSPVPVQVSGLASGVQAISAGKSHTCALVNGGAWCWGDNASGSLGTGSTTNSSVPILVLGLGSGVQAISATDQSCAVVNGSAWCWGYNSNGQVGNGSNTNSNVPVPVAGLNSGVQAIAAAIYHTCAVVNGAAWCWGGGGASGYLGNGSWSSSTVPVPVATLTSGVTSIAGSGNSCAVNGFAWCWGYNENGLLGDGSTQSSLVPAQVAGLNPGVSAIAVGFSITCAVVNGAASCWGGNYHGSLGNGSTTASGIPAPVLGLSSGVENISLHYLHACAVANGIAWCWGYNSNGQLGNGSTTDSSVPVQVVGLPQSM